VPAEQPDPHAAWNAWRLDVFGSPYLVWHDGPDFDRLLALGAADPVGVESMLAAGLAAQDPLAAQSIAALADARIAPAGAAAMLAGMTATGALLIGVAQARFALTGDQSAAESIVSVLLSDEHWGVRLDAARALADFVPTPALIRALGEAVCDREYLVRYHAANTLLRYAGKVPDISTRPKLFAKITRPDKGKPSKTDRAGWQSVAEKLTAKLRSR
jgi:hypothetical protein